MKELVAPYQRRSTYQIPHGPTAQNPPNVAVLYYDCAPPPSSPHASFCRDPRLSGCASSHTCASGHVQPQCPPIDGGRERANATLIQGTRGMNICQQYWDMYQQNNSHSTVLWGLGIMAVTLVTLGFLTQRRHRGINVHQRAPQQRRYRAPSTSTASHTSSSSSSTSTSSLSDSSPDSSLADWSSMPRQRQRRHAILRRS